MPTRPTHKFDATDKVLGRLAVDAANLLRGKNKPDYTPNIENGDQVVVYNLIAMKITGRKLENKKYYSHSGYLGNLKEKQLSQMPMDVVFYKAVRGMLPNNKLRPIWLRRLKLYVGDIPQRDKKLR